MSLVISARDVVDTSRSILCVTMYTMVMAMATGISESAHIACHNNFQFVFYLYVFLLSTHPIMVFYTQIGSLATLTIEYNLFVSQQTDDAYQLDASDRPATRQRQIREWLDLVGPPLPLAYIVVPYEFFSKASSSDTLRYHRNYSTAEELPVCKSKNQTTAHRTSSGHTNATTPSDGFWPMNTIPMNEAPSQEALTRMLPNIGHTPVVMRSCYKYAAAQSCVLSDKMALKQITSHGSKRKRDVEEDYSMKRPRNSIFPH